MPRYFLMRCAEPRVVERSQARGVWPVTLGPLDRLNEAYASGEEIVLVFTVSGSGHFQGAARMKSPASREASGGSSPGYTACRVAWMMRRDLPYGDTEHLINPLSEPPQPVRANKDGTEIDPAVAQELLALLEKAPAPAPKPVAAADGSASPPRAGGGGGGVVGEPKMVGAGLMVGMAPGAFPMLGANPMAAAMMMNPLLMNPLLNPQLAAMMMAGGLPGMMAAGMKPAGSVVAAGSSGAAAGVKLDPGGAKLEPGAGGRQEERLRDERERERERSYSRDEPFDRPMPRGAPPPLPRDGPPPYGFRDRPPPPHLRDRGGPPPGFDRFDRRGPPGWDWGPPPRDFGGPPPGWGGPRRGDSRSPPPRERERERDERPDLLRMSYEDYLARFRQLKQTQSRGSDGAGDKAAAAPAEGKENGSGSGAAAAAEGAPAEEAAGGGGGGAAGMMPGEEEYVQHLARFAAQMGMPFDASMATQQFRSMKAAMEAGARPGAGAGAEGGA